MVSFTLLPPYFWGKSSLYPSDRSLDEPQSKSRRCGEEKNVTVPGIEPVPSSQNASSPALQDEWTEGTCVLTEQSAGPGASVFCRNRALH
jgi:hypothetical protein